MRLEKISSSVLPEYQELLASDENYLAYAFAFLLDWLLQREHSVGLQILHQLCVYNNDKFPLNTGRDIRIATRALSQRIPDIKVFSEGKLLTYIGVTFDSKLGTDQLACYKEALNSCYADIKSVVLLTGFNFRDDVPPDIKHVRWFEVYNLLANIKAELQDPINKYFMEQFMSVLKERRLV